MKSSNDHGSPQAGRLQSKQPRKRLRFMPKTLKIAETWNTFRDAVTVRVSVLRKHQCSSAIDIEKAVETLPVAAVATILQQYFEEQIQELKGKIVAVGFEPTILSLEPRSEQEALE